MQCTAVLLCCTVAVLLSAPLDTSGPFTLHSLRSTMVHRKGFVGAACQSLEHVEGFTLGFEPSVEPSCFESI